MESKNERRKLISEKVMAVHQKENRKNFIDILPPNLGSEFTKLTYITCPDDQTIIRDAFNLVKAIRKNEAGGSSEFNNFRSYCKEVSWEKQVESIIKGFSFSSRNKRTFLSVRGREFPIFVVDFDFAKSNISRILEVINYDTLLLVTEDYNQGILLDHYGGYLLHDPNPREIVYEIVAWGFCEMDVSFV